MQKRTAILLSSLMLGTAVCSPSLHYCKIMTGAFMGAGLGGICGGSNGVLPGMMTGMAVGTMAEMAEHRHCHRPHHCHEVYYTHEIRPSRSSLEHEVARLQKQLRESNLYNQHLQDKADSLKDRIEQKDFKISKLERRIGQLEHKLTRIPEFQTHKELV